MVQFKPEAVSLRRSHDAYPDGVLNYFDADGVACRIAVVYVTSKYTTASIISKDNDFQKYDGAIWVGDTDGTVARLDAIGIGSSKLKGVCILGFLAVTTSE